MEKMMNCKSVAELFGVKVPTVRAWIKAKKLEAIRIGRDFYIPESAVMKLQKRSMSF